MLINENRWRAMRYSFDEGLIDLARGVVVPFEELLDVVGDDDRPVELTLLLRLRVRRGRTLPL